jgi:hypothetical protein
MPKTIIHHDAFELRRVTPVPAWRQRNHMSKSEWHRRRRLQREGAPGSENLLPKTIRLSAHREGVTLAAEIAWQELQESQSLTASAIAPGKRRHARASV